MIFDSMTTQSIIDNRTQFTTLSDEEPVTLTSILDNFKKNIQCQGFKNDAPRWFYHEGSCTCIKIFPDVCDFCHVLFFDKANYAAELLAKHCTTHEITCLVKQCIEDLYLAPILDYSAITTLLVLLGNMSRYHDLMLTTFQRILEQPIPSPTEAIKSFQKRFVVHIWSRLGSITEIPQQWFELLQHGDAMTREAIASAFGGIERYWLNHLPTLIDFLTQALDDPEPSVHIAASCSLV